MNAIRNLLVIVLLAGLHRVGLATTLYDIGNSLTVDMYSRVATTAAMNGFKLSVGLHIRTAEPLDYIWDHPADTSPAYTTSFGLYPAALPSYAWDVVTLQPYISVSNAASTLGSDITTIEHFIDLTRSGPSQHTRFLIYAPWPNQAAFNGNYDAYWNQTVAALASQPTIHAKQYFEHLLQAVDAHYGGTVDIALLPVGSVFDELDAEIRAGAYPGITSVNALYRDDTHMADAGRFVAMMTLYATIFGVDPTGAAFPIVNYQSGQGPTLTLDLAHQLQASVWRALTPRVAAYAVPLPAAAGLFVAAWVVMTLWRRKFPGHDA